MAGFFASLFLLFATGVPIALALGIAAMSYLFLSGNGGIILAFPQRMMAGVDQFILLTIPLFLLAGTLMNVGGITDRIVVFARAMVGHRKGGMSAVTVLSSGFFAGISGSATAEAAALGSILIPEMKKRGYPAPFAAAVTSSSASLAIIIPPSIPMILYAVSAGTSVEQIFVAGFLPGFLGATGLAAVAWWFARKHDFPREAAFDFKVMRATMLDALPAFALPVIILGGIFGGLVTATEGGGLAVVAAVVVGLWYREIDWGQLKIAILEGGIQTAVVMLLVAASVLMGSFLTTSRVPQNLAAGMIELTTNKYLILLILNIFFLIIGFFLHSSAAIILVVPIVVPLIQQAGIDPVHFGLVVTLNLAIGQQTPPVASVLITACSIAKANIWDVSKVNFPFILVLLAVLLLCTYVEAIPMFLVHAVYG